MLGIVSDDAASEKGLLGVTGHGECTALRQAGDPYRMRVCVWFGPEEYDLE